MEMTKIKDIRSENFYKGKEIWIEGVINAIENPKPIVEKIEFECPFCMKKLPVAQETDIIQEPAICDCGRRGSFKIIDRKITDVGYITLIDPFEISDTIKIRMKGDKTAIDMWNTIRIGTKIKVAGKLNFDINKKGKVMSWMIDADTAERLGELNFEEKKQIFLAYIKRNFSSIEVNKKSYRELASLGIGVDDLPILVEDLQKEDLVYYSKKREITMRDDFDKKKDDSSVIHDL